MENVYEPKFVKVTEIVQQSPTVKSFKFEQTGFFNFDKDDDGMVFYPGQFLLVGNIGWGESAFGAMSSPYQDKYMEIMVRSAGRVTNYLHSIKVGDKITIRGPFGNGFPLDFFRGRDIVMVTGGCGIPPIMALAEYIIKHRKDFGSVYLLYGARSPEEILIKDRLEMLKTHDINVTVTIEKAVAGWTGPVGFVTELIKDIHIDEKNAAVAMCGPGPMMNAIEKVLRPLGIADRNIFVNMECKMQCGVGKCQHCTCGEKYVCKDGPVFNFDEVDKNWD